MLRLHDDTDSDDAIRLLKPSGEKVTFSDVGGLEDVLGKQLFVRDASRLQLTAAGEELLPAVSKSFDRIEQTLNAIRDDRQAKRALRIHNIK